MNIATFHFNKLTPAEAERLSILAEECAEVIQCVEKIKRHGYESYNPLDDEPVTNRDDLAREVGHIHAILGLMEGDTDAGADLSHGLVHDSQANKLRTLPRWTHHQSWSKLEGEKEAAK